MLTMEEYTRNLEKRIQADLSDVKDINQLKQLFNLNQGNEQLIDDELYLFSFAMDTDECIDKFSQFIHIIQNINDLRLINDIEELNPESSIVNLDDTNQQFALKLKPSNYAFMPNQMANTIDVFANLAYLVFSHQN